MSTDFFNTIPKITQFAGAIDEQNFHPAPEDWVIVIADIRNSTAAVSEGRYKDVNIIGGAVICAVQNATGSHNYPFVFGGDGATLAINEKSVPLVRDALVRTRSMADKEFNLDLRIGFVPVRLIRKKAADLLIARYQVNPGNCFALFGGGGVELADALIKADEDCKQFAVPAYSLPGLPDLSGLSCRWESLSTNKGRILCLLVKPRSTNFQEHQNILSEFLSELTSILGTTLSQANPINSDNLHLGWPPKGLSAEAKATRQDKSYLRRLIELYLSSLLQWCLDRSGFKIGHYDGHNYRNELSTNSDYCKFDDVLRMVLDCTAEQIKAIRALLNAMRDNNDIDFGLFETEHALITCLLQDLETSQHLHFIDGDDGGFWSASMQLKQQLSSGVDFS